MKKDPNNVYQLLKNRQLHERMTSEVLSEGASYAVVGGLGAHAVINTQRPDWDEGVVTVDSTARLPRVRENGTVRDLDMLVHCAKSEVAAHRKGVDDIIGEAMVSSVFGLRPYETNRHGIADFVGDRYFRSDDGQLFWRIGGIETPIPSESLEPWRVEQDGQTIKSTTSRRHTTSNILRLWSNTARLRRRGGSSA